MDQYDCGSDEMITDSMPLHYQAWYTALKEWGGEFPEALFYAWVGIPIAKTVELIKEVRALYKMSKMAALLLLYFRFRSPQTQDELDRILEFSFSLENNMQLG